MTQALDDLDAAVAAVKLAFADAADQLASVTRQRDAVAAELDEVKSTWTPPATDAPAFRKPLIGISGPVEIDGFCERWFDGGAGIGKIAPRRPLAVCPRQHRSFKASVLPTDSQIIAQHKNAQPFDKTELEHEHDVDYRKAIKAGTSEAVARAALDKRVALKTAYHRAIVRLREAGKIPYVETVCTVSSFSLMPAEFAGIDKFLCEADVFGADLDGDDAGTGGYMNYGDPVRLQNIQATADRKFKGRWTVPEHGWANTKPGERIPHFRQTIPAIAKFGPEEIQIFHSAGFAPLFTAAEIEELKVIARPWTATDA